MLIVAVGGFSLILLAFARSSSTKEEWKKEKSNNYSMIATGAGFFLFALLIMALLNL